MLIIFPQTFARCKLFSRFIYCILQLSFEYLFQRQINKVFGDKSLAFFKLYKLNMLRIIQHTQDYSNCIIILFDSLIFIKYSNIYLHPFNVIDIHISKLKINRYHAPNIAIIKKKINESVFAINEKRFQTWIKHKIWAKRLH